MLQTSAAVGFLAVVASAAIQTVLPDPPRIEIHSITVADGMVTQDRTVNSDAPTFWMRWSATIVDLQTGMPIADCTGSGEFNYPTGRHAKTMTIKVWTGNDKCDLPPGHYVPQAIYIWGDDQVSAVGEEFGVTQ